MPNPFQRGPTGVASTGGTAAGSLAGGHAVPFLVLVKNDGGASYPCTYTYTLFPIGANVSDSSQRFAGATSIAPTFAAWRDGAMNAAASGSYGLAVYVGGAWLLLFVAETPITRTC